MKTKITALLFLIFQYSTISCTQTVHNTKDKKSILGSWEMKQINWITKDTTYSIEKAQPGIYIFSPKRYSIMWTPIDHPRIPFKNLSKPTDEETINGFRSVVFNGGTYNYTDSTLTTTATIAKVPGFEGGCSFTIMK